MKLSAYEAVSLLLIGTGLGIVLSICSICPAISTNPEREDFDRGVKYGFIATEEMVRLGNSGASFQDISDKAWEIANIDLTLE